MTLAAGIAQPGLRTRGMALSAQKRRRTANRLANRAALALSAPVGVVGCRLRDHRISGRHAVNPNTLRDQTARGIDAGCQTDLRAFPSYSTAIALILVLVTHGIGPLFWPMLILNLGVLVAVPAKGDHDLANRLAGVAITALACLLLAGRDRVAADARRR